MACLLCGSDAYRVLDKSTAMIRSSFEGAKIVRCRLCGLDYLDPVPAQPSDLYEEDYWRAYQDAGMVFPTEATLHARYLERLRAVERRSGPGRLLEIGIGHGGFMTLAAQHGWNATGVELSKYAASYVKDRFGLEVICGSVESVELPAASYDMIHLSHVLEHLTNPLAVLGRIRTLLAPAGVLAIEVPNELENLYVRIRRASGRLAAYPVRSTHITFFTPQSLRRMLERAGLSVTHLTTLRDETDPRPVRRVVKRMANAVERRINRGPLIEAFAIDSGSEP